MWDATQLLAESGQESLSFFKASSMFFHSPPSLDQLQDLYRENHQTTMLQWKLELNVESPGMFPDGKTGYEKEVIFPPQNNVQI